MAYLAIDFGGTRMRAAWFTHNMTLLDRNEMPTRATDPEDVIVNRIIEVARSVGPLDTLPNAIGIAGPGPLDAKNGVILHAATLPGWNNVPLVKLVREAFGSVPTFLQNDANLAALAEARIGAGRDHDPTLYLTLSTGIGGGVVIGGQLFTGSQSLAPEPGHQVFRLADGSVKKLEQLASGTALGRTAAERLAADASIQSVLRDVAEVDGAAVGRAALADDAFALDVVNEAATWLGLGIVNLLHLFNPAAVVLGGSVTNLGELLLHPVRETVAEHVLNPGFAPDDLIRLAALGDDVCLHGAGYYAQMNFISQQRMYTDVN